MSETLRGRAGGEGAAGGRRCGRASLDPCYAARVCRAARTLPQREFVYSHKWRVNDLVMWDNRQTMHRGRAYPPNEARDVRRTTVQGDAPTVEQAVAA